MHLFGGMEAFPYSWNFRNFSHFKGKVYSLFHDFPSFHELLKNRIESATNGGVRCKGGQKIQQDWYDSDQANLKRMFECSTTVLFPHNTNKVVIGDSHSICMYRPGWTVNSVPFTTLNGALNRGLDTYITPIRASAHIAEIECYFGNIDIRHHICRLSQNEDQARVDLITDLAQRYVNAVSELPIPKKAIYELLPIENESRKVPLPGHYKGKAFWGTWVERNNARMLFNDLCEKLCIKNGIRFIRWTDYLTNARGELDFRFMEKPHSIHLSREFYPHWNGTEYFPTPEKKTVTKKKEVAATDSTLDEFFS
jgi:hypothetical protein